MPALRQVITLPISICAFVSIFFATGKLILFLSTPSKINAEYVWLLNLLDNRTRFEGSLQAITIDCLLIVTFIVQHSLLRAEIIKTIWRKLGLETVERSIYNLATAGTILLLVKEWRPIPSFTLWNVDVESNKVLWYAFITTHTVSWIIIFGGSVILDLPELTGVKQVYYDFNNLLPPLAYKSRDLVRLYGHIRHPSFFGLSLILWCANIMSLDRLLLAILWTSYMLIAWRTDERDVAYQKAQLKKKKIELLS